MRLRLLVLLSTLCLAMSGAYVSAASAADPTVTISGTVLDDAGQALPGVEVAADLDLEGPSPRSTTDAAGRYEVEIPPPGQRYFEMFFSKPGGWIETSRSLAVDGTPVAGIDAQMQQLATVRGTITSATAIPRGTVARLNRVGGAISGESAFVEDDGSFVIDKVEPGRYYRDVDLPGPRQKSVATDVIDVGSGDDITLAPAQVVDDPRGYIRVDLPGMKRSSVDVTSTGVDEPGQSSALISSEFGYSTLEQVRPGRHKIALGDGLWFGGLSEASATPVDVSAGETTKITAEIGPRFYLEGRVVDSAGQGIDKLALEVLRSDSPGEVVAHTSTVRGSFQVGDLPEADYQVRVTDGRGVYATETFDVPVPTRSRPDDPVDEYVVRRATPLGAPYPGPASAVLTGRRVPDGGAPPRVCLVPTNGLRDDQIVCEGSDPEAFDYEVRGIKPGDYKVLLDGETYRLDEATWLGGRSFDSATIVSFSPGERKKIDLPQLGATTSLFGTVHGRRGIPTPALTVLAYAADDSDEIIGSTIVYFPFFTDLRVPDANWRMEHLGARPYKIKIVDSTGTFESRWVGGSSFAEATVVQPLLLGTRLVPDATLTPRLGALAPPIVSGEARVGGAVATTDGFWTLPGLTFSYQWLRDGAPIAGATSASYAPALTDAGGRLSVRVTGQDGGGARASATSLASAAVSPPPPGPVAGRAAPVVRTKVTRLGGGKVRITVTYSSQRGVPTGRVSLRRGSKTVMSWRYLRNGKLTVVLKKQPRKRVRYTVRYSGSGSVLADTRRTPSIRVR